MVSMGNIKEYPISGRLCGVYLLYLEGELVYIGQSTNIAARLSMTKTAYDKAFYVEAPVEDLNMLETALIRKHSPVFNIRKSANKQTRGKGGGFVYIKNPFSDTDLQGVLNKYKAA